LQNDVSKRFSEHIRRLRQARGWTQEQAASACDIGYKLYQLYELGVKRNPGLLTLDKIAHGFGLEVYELLGPEMPIKQVAVRKIGPRGKVRSHP